MECNQCGIKTQRSVSLIGTVVEIGEEKILLEVTEPEDRIMSVDYGGKPFAFPFELTDAKEKVQLCSLNCLRLWILENIDEKI